MYYNERLSCFSTLTGDILPLRLHVWPSYKTRILIMLFLMLNKYVEADDRSAGRGLLHRLHRSYRLLFSLKERSQVKYNSCTTVAALISILF